MTAKETARSQQIVVCSFTKIHDFSMVGLSVSQYVIQETKLSTGKNCTSKLVALNVLNGNSILGIVDQCYKRGSVINHKQSLLLTEEEMLRIESSNPACAPLFQKTNWFPFVDARCICSKLGMDIMV